MSPSNNRRGRERTKVLEQTSWELRARGMTTRAIAAELGIDQSYVVRLLRKRVYENVRLCRIKTSEHQMGHGQVDPRLARLLRPLVVLAQPTIPAQPRERPLHDPTPRQHLDLLRLTFLRLGRTTNSRIQPPTSLVRVPQI